MSVKRALSRATTPALAGLAICGLVVSGIAGELPAVQAAATAPASLHVTGSVVIGKGSKAFTPMDVLAGGPATVVGYNLKTNTYFLVRLAA